MIHCRECRNVLNETERSRKGRGVLAELYCRKCRVRLYLDRKVWSTCKKKARGSRREYK